MDADTMLAKGMAVLAILTGAALIIWLIVGVSFGVTYSRDKDAACVARGGVLVTVGQGRDACVRLTLVDSLHLERH